MRFVTAITFGTTRRSSFRKTFGVVGTRRKFCAANANS
jgi:hypothetical protein